MAKSPAYVDESIRNRILAAVEDTEGCTPEQRTGRILKSLLPVVGSVAQRRRSESSMRAAFKEGFQVGQRAGRFSRWHSIIWAQSMLCRRLRTDASQLNPREAELRARYNDV